MNGSQSANTFSSLMPLFKESYAGSTFPKSIQQSFNTHTKPGKEPRFAALKAKLKKSKVSKY